MNLITVDETTTVAECKDLLTVRPTANIVPPPRIGPGQILGRGKPWGVPGHLLTSSASNLRQTVLIRTDGGLHSLRKDANLEALRQKSVPALG